MSRQNTDRYPKPSTEVAPKSTQTGFVKVLTSVFGRRAQHVVIPEPSPVENTIHNQLSDSDLIGFWLNKFNMLQTIPEAKHSYQEMQSAMAHVFKHQQGSVECHQEIINCYYKMILMDVAYTKYALEHFPDFVCKIPPQVLSDRLFLLNLHKYNPDILLILSIALLKDFTPLRLFDPVTNTLKNNWVCIEHYRDHKIAVMKSMSQRIYIDIIDVWLLNVGIMSRLALQARTSHQAFDMFSKLRVYEDIIRAQQEAQANLSANPDIMSAPPIRAKSEYDTDKPQQAPYPFIEDDTDPNPDIKGRGFTKLNSQTIGRKFTLHHPERGWIDVILTDVLDDRVEFVIYSGDLVGCKTSCPINLVSSCLVAGDPNSRILNTNVIRVKT